MPRLRSRSLVLGMVLGAAATIAVALAVAVLMLRGSTPPLTRGSFDAALARWGENGPASYDLDLVQSAGQSGVIHVEVRDGAVTAMTRDGVAPKQRRTWDYWSVPGLSQIIRDDLDKAHPPRKNETPANLVLRAAFDPQYGYPQRYERIDLTARHETRWDVTRFTPRKR